MLNEMRFGRLSQKSADKFRSLSRPIQYDDGLGPTELFPRREDVDRSNSTRINRLQTPMHTFRAIDGGQVQDQTQREKMLGNFMAVPMLTLRQDAQVMLIKNLDETLVTGAWAASCGFASRLRMAPNAMSRAGATAGRSRRSPLPRTPRRNPLSCARYAVSRRGVFAPEWGEADAAGYARLVQD
ncbi:hypothetical protein B0H13DRAFT_1088533 [Mycena leptocephala]|nr:hypothetical protein B0H13DRAFT_1088533 [Mycena leptocephala]